MMAEVEEKRLFIGGLVKGVKEEELVEKFSRFGQVANVDIKTRSTEIDSKIFAYLNLTADENAFKKCFTAYNNTKWKGGQLKIQFAKESFLSKLKKEQAEAKLPKEKKEPAVYKSPALYSVKKAVPGTLMDDSGKWVMGKYSRVLPVLNLRKPGSRQTVTIDPSKHLHCLKKIKDDDKNNVDNVKITDLTWELEENTSEINKRRQGIFPPMETPRNQPTPEEKQASIAARLKEIAAQERISDTEMEVVPAGKTLPVSRIRSHSGFDSDNDSADSADTDEIVFKASAKKVLPASKIRSHSGYDSDNDSASSADTDEIVFKASGKKTLPASKIHSHSGYDSDDDSASSADTDEIVSKASTKKVLEPKAKKSTSVEKGKMKKKTKELLVEGKAELDDGDKNISVNGSSSKKTPSSFSTKKELAVNEQNLSSNKKTKKAKEQGRIEFQFVKTPTMKGTVLKKSTKLSTKVSQKEESDDDVSAEDQSADNAEMTLNKTPEFKGLGMLSSDSDEETLPQTAVTPQNSKVKSAERTTPAKITPGKKISSLVGKKTTQEDSSSDSEEAYAHNLKQKKSLRKPENMENFSQSKEATKSNGSSGHFDSPVTTGVSLRKGVKPVYSDDSDLDDNDLERVAKKLEAKTFQQKQKNGKRQRTDSSAGDDCTPDSSVSKIKNRKTSQDETSHLSSLQKSHHAYKKTLEEMRKRENLVTKMLREGTGSKHVTFSDSEEEDMDAKSEPKKMSLLYSDSDSDDDDDDGDVDFSSKPQFDGEKGKKLFERQSQIMDSRFRFDDRFASDDSEDEDKEEDKEEESLKEMAEEKKRNMDILIKVLGYKPGHKPRHQYESMTKRRYTPDSAEDFALTPKKKKKSTGEEVATTEHADSSEEEDIKDSRQEEEEDKEEVTFISPKDLQPLFSGDSSFSLFGQPVEEESDLEKEEKVEETGKDDNKDNSKADDDDTDTSEDDKDDEMEDDNDSEADEDDEEEGNDAKDKKINSKADEDDEEEGNDTKDKKSNDNRALEHVSQKAQVREKHSFILASDDPRLKAAVRFFHRPHPEEFEELSERWPEERQKLMEMVRERHKRACRKNKRKRGPAAAWKHHK